MLGTILTSSFYDEWKEPRSRALFPLVVDALTLPSNMPRAEEVISYKIPAYRRTGEIVLYFAGWKQRYSLYPAAERMVSAFKDQLVSYKVSKGTIRFPLSEPVPVKLIERIAKFRVEEAVQREKSKPAAEKE
jgi:uncharacterized protein YdhG (YjbR/CyaY superfamily)